MRRILAVTSGRADASPMAPVIKALEGRCDTWLVSPDEVLGPQHMQRSPSNRFAMMAAHLTDDAMAWEPEVVVLLGDRYEILAAASAATLARVPIAHIHGGEASYGSFDNQIRDAVSKLSHIHFVAAEPYRDRLIAIGEDPRRIHVVGAPGLDNLVGLPPRVQAPHFMVTYHPATLSNESPDGLIEALSRFEDCLVFWTGTNSDPGADEIYRKFKDRFWLTHLTSNEYLGVARNAAAIVGNSSSGIIEAPSLGVPTVNVGSRQDGRLKGPSIIDCKDDADSIEAAIKKALRYKGPYNNPYGGPGASQRIADTLTTIDLEGILVK